MFLKIFFIIPSFFLLVTTNFLYAQSPDTVWTKSFGGSEMDPYGYGFQSRFLTAIDENDNIYTLANTRSNDYFINYDYGTTDVWIMKLSPTGDTLWTLVLGGSQEDYGTQIRSLSEGGCLVTGYTKSNDGVMTGHHGETSETDAFIAKISANGEIVWLNQYGGSEYFGIPGNDYFYDIIILENGNYLAAGQTNSQNGDVSEYVDLNLFYTGWAAEFDSDGNIIRSERLYTPTHDEYNLNIIYRIIEKPAKSGFYMAGQSQFPMTPPDYIWVMSLDTALNINWQNTYGSNGQNLFYNITACPDNSILLSNTVQSTGGDVEGSYHGGYNDVWLVKVDSTGNITDQKLIGGSQSETIYKIIDGGTSDKLFMAGMTRSVDYYAHGDTTTGADFWLLSMDQNLDTLWTWKDGGDDIDVLTNIDITSNNQLLVSGRTNSDNGIIHNNLGDKDAWLAKLDVNIQGNNLENREHKPNFFPNPAHNHITVSNALQVKIYTINGRLIFTDNPNVKHKTYSIRQLDPGVYIVKLKNKINEYATGKLIVL